MMKRKKTVNIATDVPKEIKKALQEVDGSKVSDAKINQMITTAKNELLTGTFKLGGTFRFKDYLPMRSKIPSYESLSVHDVPQEVANFISSIDWTWVNKNIKTMFRIPAKTFMTSWIKGNLPKK